MPNIDEDIDTVRASRAGHTFHERWAARRALQLVFPYDDLSAIAVEGISSTETTSPGARAEEVADLVLYYGRGDNFRTCERLETVQFKYKLREEAVTAAYLKKTIEKFADTILGYEKEFSSADVDKKLSFIFVTNAEFKDSLWDAIASLIEGTTASAPGAAAQAHNLKTWCAGRGLSDASRLFSRIVFRAGEKDLAGQDNALRRTLTDWSAGADSEARLRLHGLQDLVLKKAGPSGQGKNLIRREDVLDAFDCEPEDLFPADTRFVDVGAVVERAELSTVKDLVKTSGLPVFIHAEGGVGKTVFVQSIASKMMSEFEVVVFDCFGGGSYRSDNHSRHLPSIGLVQIVNELASRTLCDPMLPHGDNSRRIIKAARRRLAQAATAIRTQSKKLGLLIIVDAADNAQLEAEYRHEEAFPKLLLSSIGEDSIDGVKLLLTVRTHRKDKVIGRTTVKEVELGPFTDSEARKFLQDRKPRATGVEIATALVRSGRNARVLDYLVQTWDTNVLGKTLATPITVTEIIAQRCTKIVSDLHVAGWADSEVNEFFVALSLLPPPIPLEELANALGWSAAQVNTAASDLAPMLEITSHGAIFRDEPTETYVRETFSARPEAQRTIADRLISSQATSAYAAEALPHFLVVIKDSDRAFALADSTNFPTTVQSEFGRRRLTLARLRAAFRLAVAEDDFDRVLGLIMRLAQVATANIRGDEFIRSSPALAILLGDADSYRRLFSDRSGWRGARSARLTVAHLFANDTEEAQIQCESTVRWINWHIEQPRDELRDHAGPEVEDFAAVLFQRVTEGEFSNADSNLARWNRRFALSASDELLQMLDLFDLATGTTVLGEFVSFASSDQCTSHALKLRLLSRPCYLNKQQVKALAKGLRTPASADDGDEWLASTILAGRRQLSWPVKRSVVNPSFPSFLA
ncbi:MAG: NACHT domain-containing protein [Telluria sp.]